MEVEIYELVSSDICKLIYDYLIRIDLNNVAILFLENCIYLKEFTHRKQNRKFICTVNGLNLEQWLDKAALIFSLQNYIQNKYCHYKINDPNLLHKNIVEQVDMLLNRIQTSSPQETQQEFNSNSNKNINNLGIESLANEDDVLKKLTQKDKKILADVFEKKDNVSELLAQKISEEINKNSKRSRHRNIDDIAHRIAEKTASDDIIVDLCAEMYEEGFLSEFTENTNAVINTATTLQTPNKPKKLFSPIKTPSKLFPNHNTNSFQSTTLNETIYQPTPSSSSLLVPAFDSTNINSSFETTPKKYHELKPFSFDSPKSETIVNSSNLNISIPSYETQTNASVTSHSPTESTASSNSSKYTTATPVNNSAIGNTMRIVVPSTSGNTFTLGGQMLYLLPVVSTASPICPIQTMQSPITPFTSNQTYVTTANSLHKRSTSHPFYQNIIKSSSKKVLKNFCEYPAILPKSSTSTIPHCKSLEQNISTPYNIKINVLGNISTVNDNTNLITDDKSRTQTITGSESPYKLNSFLTFNQNNVQMCQSKNSTNENSSQVTNHLIKSITNLNKTDIESINTQSNQNENINQSLKKSNYNLRSNNQTQNDSNLNSIDSNQSMNYPTQPNLNDNEKLDSITENKVNDDLDQTQINQSHANNVEIISNKTVDEKSNNNTEINKTNELLVNTNETTTTTDVVNTQNLKHIDIKSNSSTCIIENNNENSDKLKIEQINSKIIQSTVGNNNQVNNLNSIDNKLDNSENILTKNNDKGDLKDNVESDEQNLIDEQNVTNENTSTESVETNKEQTENIKATETILTNETSSVDEDEPIRTQLSNSLLNDNVDFIIGEELLDSSYPLNNTNEVLNSLIIVKPDESLENDKEKKKCVDSDQSIDVTNVKVQSGSDDQNRNETLESLDKSTENIHSNQHKEFENTDENIKASNKTSGKEPITEIQEPVNTKIIAKESPSTMFPKIFKRSPNLLKETLTAKLSPLEKVELNANQSFNVEFLKSTPAVKVLSTPKRKSSSTPRRSHVRALRFETPMKPSVTKRKCNTSPKLCRNQTPLIIERIKPSVSRNLCEDKEMQKEIPEQQPWDSFLRRIAANDIPVANKRPRKNKRFKRGKKGSEGKKETRTNIRTRNKRKMKTIDENREHNATLNGSTDQNKDDSIKSNGSGTKKRRSRNTKIVKTNNQETSFKQDSDFEHNEANSVLSLNLEDTPLKIADFQDDIQNDFKTPLKDHILPTSLGFTPIDNIIRNNIGATESLLKIIDDINMFKETETPRDKGNDDIELTPIKDQLDNLNPEEKIKNKPQRRKATTTKKRKPESDFVMKNDNPDEPHVLSDVSQLDDCSSKNIALTNSKQTKTQKVVSPKITKRKSTSTCKKKENIKPNKKQISTNEEVESHLDENEQIANESKNKAKIRKKRKSTTSEIHLNEISNHSYHSEENDLNSENSCTNYQNRKHPEKTKSKIENEQNTSRKRKKSNPKEEIRKPKRKKQIDNVTEVNIKTKTEIKNDNLSNETPSSSKSNKKVSKSKASSALNTNLKSMNNKSDNLIHDNNEQTIKENELQTVNIFNQIIDNTLQNTSSTNKNIKNPLRNENSNDTQSNIKRDLNLEKEEVRQFKNIGKMNFSGPCFIHEKINEKLNDFKQIETNQNVKDYEICENLVKNKINKSNETNTHSANLMLNGPVENCNKTNNESSLVNSNQNTILPNTMDNQNTSTIPINNPVDGVLQNTTLPNTIDKQNTSTIPINNPVDGVLQNTILSNTIDKQNINPIPINNPVDGALQNIIAINNSVDSSIQNTTSTSILNENISSDNEDDMENKVFLIMSYNENTRCIKDFEPIRDITTEIYIGDEKITLTTFSSNIINIDSIQ